MKENIKKAIKDCYFNTYYVNNRRIIISENIKRSEKLFKLFKIGLDINIENIIIRKYENLSLILIMSDDNSDKLYEIINRYYNKYIIYENILITRMFG